MKYIVMIYESPGAFEARTAADQESYWGAWKAYAQAIRDAGCHAGGAGLEQPSTAATLRIRDGKRVVQDGPFADTKEQLGGFFILDVPNLDAALDWAARCPASSDGVLEVRPVLGECAASAAREEEIQAALAR